MDPIYLDHAATTPVREEVREAMEPHLHGCFGNPSSPHKWGREAAAALAEARDAVATAVGVRFTEVYFTRGGTESDNLAIRGRVRRLVEEGHAPSVVTTAIEHKAVLNAASAAVSEGARRRVVLEVAPDGSLDEEPLKEALASSEPTVVSAMWVNNETGLVLDVPALAGRVREAGGTFHCDAVQALGKLPVRLDEVPIDLLTLTGHKIYGPKSVGVLIARQGTGLRPLLHGGGQEQGLRPGTEDVCGAVGLARAVTLAVAEREATARRLADLRERLEERLIREVEGLRIHAGDARRAPHVSSVGIPGVDGSSLLMSLDLEGVAVSGGSACQSGAQDVSHVIRALYGDDAGIAVVRYSLGRSTTEAEVDRAARATAEVVARLRSGAPV